MNEGCICHLELAFSSDIHRGVGLGMGLGHKPGSLVPEPMRTRDYSQKFPQHGKGNSQVQDVQRVPNRINPRRNITRHILV